MLVLAEPSWANSAQRIALRLQRDDVLRDLVTSHVIPVLVNPEERPDLVAEWRWASMALTDTAGPPLLVFLTHEGLPFLAYCTMNVEGDDTYPSLVSLIQSLAETYPDNADSLCAEARDLSSIEKVPAVNEAGESGWGSLRQRLDLRRGGLSETPKHPQPSLLLALLDAHAEGELPNDILSWLRATLDAMIRGGIWDQIDRGFHRCTRNDLWVVPHFEKPIPLNAQLAEVYARAADQLEDNTFHDVAARLVSFCIAALREGVDVIASDTEYYTWTSKEILGTLDPALVQVVSLHYDIKPVHERQALRRVVEMEQMDRYSHESVDVLRTRLIRGRAQLRSARLRRPSPRTISLSALSWRAESVRWLLKAGAWSDAVDVSMIVAVLEQLIDGRLDPAYGYARDSSNESSPNIWLEDQAALLAAFLDAHRTTGDQPWLDRAQELANLLMTVWWTDNTGWLDQPGASTPSKSAIDDVLPSTLDTLRDALQVLGSITGEPRYAERAAATRDVQRRLAIRCGHWSASLPR